MRIAVHSASASVTRTLEAMITASGHNHTAHEPADWVLIDTVHLASSPPPSGERLMLVSALNAAEPTSSTALACPLKPERLLQRLMMLASTQRLALAHGWTLDVQARILQHPSASSVNLTEKETMLLTHLQQAQAKPLRREDLLAQVWGMASEIDTHTLETHIYRLRSKLNATSPRPCDILTQDGAYSISELL